MPDNMTFATIPIDIRTPGQYLEIDNTKAVRGLPSMDRRILVVGNKLPAGAAPVAALRRINSASEAIGYFGRGSVLHEMLRYARNANKETDIWAIGLDDLMAGVAATQTATVTGTATGAGTIPLYVNGAQILVGVSLGDTPTTIAAAIAAAVNGYADGPMTAASAVGVATLTARHKGVFGNDIDVRVGYYSDDVLPAGVTVAIAAGVAGAGNPDVAAALAALTSESFYTIITPYTDSANVAKLEAEFASRWGGMDMRAGHLFGALRGTQSALATLGSARNSVHSTFMGVKSSPSAMYLWAAVLGAVCEFYGAIDPARPLQNWPLPGIMAPVEADRFTRPERNLLLKDGISTFTVGQDGTVYLERVITTYQTNAFGAEDVSYLNLETKWTVDYMRYAFRTRIALRFPNHKLADDGTNFDQSQPVATPSLIRAELIDVAKGLEEAGQLEGFADFKKYLRVVRSTTDRDRVNAMIPPDVVNQFRIFAAALQFIL